MSALTLRAPSTTSETDVDDERHVSTQDELHIRLVRAIATGNEFADIPKDSELWLLPDDDPAHVAWVLRAATEAVIPGRNLYLRWVHPADLPSLPSERKPPEALRAIEYRQDGSVARVRIADGNDWREVEPTPEDRAGLPPTPRG
ncbi:MAG: hypothetical protein QOF73_3497 [Thermomicrobiales bacterium]|nr:hypothetical protein [Thermomicrobiales bacterium]